MKKLWLIYFVLLISTITGQQKLFSIEDVVFNSYSSLAPTTVSQLNLIKGSDKLYYVNADNVLLIEEISKGNPNEIISLEELNNLLQKEKLERERSFPKINFLNNDNFIFTQNNTVIEYNIKNKSLNLIYSLPQEAENIEYSSNFLNSSFTIKNNVYFAVKGNVIKLSDENNSDIIFGQSVHRNEFGIEKGIFLSPDSKSVAFYRMDQTMVTNYPILNLDSLPAQVNYVKYPMAGGKSHEVTIGVFNSETQKQVYLETGLPKDQYLTCVTWSPDNKFIFVTILNRDQNHLDLVKFDAMTGKKIKTLFSEDDTKFVEPEHPLYFLPKSNNLFLWSSKRDGWNHLYLYDIEGNLIKQITKGNWEVTEILGFDKKVENLFYLSTEKSPLERHLYKINIKSLKTDCLTEVPGIHEIIFENGNFFIDKYNSTTIPNKIDIKDVSGKAIRNLLNSENPLKEYTVSYPQIVTLKEEGKYDLYARLILPINFDSTKKYPVIVYVYGGPHSQEITDRWIYGRYDMWFQYMAQKGYIVFSIDNRGTSYRGNDFAQATFRQLGTVEIEDHLRGVNYLKSLPYVDSERFGVYGWSYGGFMATSLMLRTNNTFKVGVGGGAVIDWKYYEIMYTERYMDTPQTNPKGFENASLLNYVKNLEGKLLLVHGTSDETVVWQHTLLFAKKATSLNKPLDYYPYVHHQHGVRGKDALQLYNKISEYFINNL